MNAKVVTMRDLKDKELLALLQSWNINFGDISRIVDDSPFTRKLRLKNLLNEDSIVKEVSSMSQIKDVITRHQRLAILLETDEDTLKRCLDVLNPNCVA